MSKTLVIYTTHCFNANVDYFIKHGLSPRPDVDFLFVINGTLTLDLPIYPNVSQVNRSNAGHDFGAWSHGLFLNDNYSRYNYYILINSSVRGPFMPIWADDDWIRCYTDRLANKVKLVGSTISHALSRHVQSTILAMDRVGVSIGIDTGIFTRETQAIAKMTAVLEKEVRLSTEILKAGYQLDSLLIPEFSSNPNHPHCVYKLVPFETIFLKCNRTFLHLVETVSKYSGMSYIEDDKLLACRAKERLPPDFDWRVYSQLHQDVAEWFPGEQLATKHWLNFGFDETRAYKFPEH